MNRARTVENRVRAAWLLGVQDCVFKNDIFFQNSADYVHNFLTFSPTPRSSYNFNHIKFTYIVIFENCKSEKIQSPRSIAQAPPGTAAEEELQVF